MKILVVHEVNYLRKIIYEFQILPEILSTLGHDVTVIDYDDSWQASANGDKASLKTRVYKRVHRAYPQASVTVRRPGMIRFPVLSRVSGAIASGLESYRFLRNHSPDAVLLYGLPTVGVQALLAAEKFGVPVLFRSIDVLNQLVPWRILVPPTTMLERFVYRRVDAIVFTHGHADHILGLDELRSYPAPLGDEFRDDEVVASVVVPMVLATPMGTLSFISTTTVFGTPVEITLSELALETFFPADAATGEILRAMAQANGSAS